MHRFLEPSRLHAWIAWLRARVRHSAADCRVWRTATGGWISSTRQESSAAFRCEIDRLVGLGMVVRNPASRNRVACESCSAFYPTIYLSIRCETIRTTTRPLHAMCCGSKSRWRASSSLDRLSTRRRMPPSLYLLRPPLLHRPTRQAPGTAAHNAGADVCPAQEVPMWCVWVSAEHGDSLGVQAWQLRKL